MPLVDHALDLATRAAVAAVTCGVEAAMNRFNGMTALPEDESDGV